MFYGIIFQNRASRQRYDKEGKRERNEVDEAAVKKSRADRFLFYQLLYINMIYEYFLVKTYSR